jgi:HD superfamily phosphohydrolase
VDPYRHKVITDPVHGAIGLSKLETQVVNTPTFQRLRRLKQLGLASLVYPNADHSRFAHSLGVFHIMGRGIGTLIHKGHLKEEDRQKLRLAALLHDVGHYPYSHLMERLDADLLRHDWLGAGAGPPPVPYPDHEELGELLVTRRPDLTSLLQSAEFNPAEIAKIFRGEHDRRIYNDLIHSSLDLDRMDYLIRDAIGTGVPFGRIDLEYLLSHLDADKDGRLGLEPKAITAAEHFMLARYFMSKVVYFHKTVFAFEALMRQVLFLLRKEGLLWPDGNAVKDAVRDESEFAKFHDDYADSVIDGQANRGDTLGALCKALRLRCQPILLKEFRELVRKGGQRSEAVIRFQTRRRDRLADLANKHGVPKECFLWEDPKDISLEKVGPFVEVASEVGPEETEELLRIVESDGRSRPLIAHENSLVHHLSHLRLRTTRLYVVGLDKEREADKQKILTIRQEVENWTKL